MRINPRNPDPEYVEKGRLALYGDVSTEEYLRFAAYFNPDLPLAVAFDDARGTPERWGTVPRTFIRTTEDRTVPLALQDRMIAEADAYDAGQPVRGALAPLQPLAVRVDARPPRGGAGSVGWARDHPGARAAARKPGPARSPGRRGGRTCPNASGARSARTTAQAAMPGTTSRTTRPVLAPTAGARTGWPASATSASGCAWRSRCGTAPTRSSRSGSSGSPTARATTARTPRSTGSTWTPRRRTRI